MRIVNLNTHIPWVLQLEIFSHLDIISLISLASSCHQYRALYGQEQSKLVHNKLFNDLKLIFINTFPFLKASLGREFKKIPSSPLLPQMGELVRRMVETYVKDIHANGVDCLLPLNSLFPFLLGIGNIMGAMRSFPDYPDLSILNQLHHRDASGDNIIRKLIKFYSFGSSGDSKIEAGKCLNFIFKTLEREIKAGPENFNSIERSKPSRAPYDLTFDADIKENTGFSINELTYLEMACAILMTKYNDDTQVYIKQMMEHCILYGFKDTIRELLNDDKNTPTLNERDGFIQQAITNKDGEILSLLIQKAGIDFETEINFDNPMMAAAGDNLSIVNVLLECKGSLFNCDLPEKILILKRMARFQGMDSVARFLELWKNQLNPRIPEETRDVKFLQIIVELIDELEETETVQLVELLIEKFDFKLKTVYREPSPSGLGPNVFGPPKVNLYGKNFLEIAHISGVKFVKPVSHKRTAPSSPHSSYRLHSTGTPNSASSNGSRPFSP